MTTREYILRDAQKDYRQLDKMDTRLHFILEMEDYSRADKALILYHHLWHATVEPRCLAELSGGGWKRIVDHTNYSPRLIEYCTGNSFDLRTKGYVNRFVDTLDHPREIWSVAYERHLTDEQRALLTVLATLPVEVNLDTLLAAYLAYCAQVGIAASARGFRSSLEITEGTFVYLSKRGDEGSVRFHSPSVAEFMFDQLVGDPVVLSNLVTSAVYFEQLRILKAARGGGVVLGVHSGSGGAKALPLGSLKERFVSALERTFQSPSPERLLNQSGYQTGYEEPKGCLENRLIFLWEQSASWRPPDNWMEDTLLSVSTRWTEELGGKSDAVKLICDGDPDIVSDDAMERARTNLESWLSEDLSETSDWNIYLDYLERTRGDRYDTALARRFEEHAINELGRWSPSPPDLDDLLTHAEGFGIDTLQESLRNKSLEDEEREDEADGRLASAARPQALGPRHEDSDKALETLFGRFVRR